MKFIFADSLDYVDPRYDFIHDQHGENRRPYWDDSFPHEILGYAPYDGMLVSRATVGDYRLKGQYSESQSMRFRREGARKFLRLNIPEFEDKLIFGDCGAFSYTKMDVPPYTPSDTVEFYSDGDFTHGCSVDHIIFEFDKTSKSLDGGSEISHERFEITLELAELFIKESKQSTNPFIPIGVIQGWSPDSMAIAAERLIKMGYKYLAIGGLVPLGVKDVHEAVSAVHDVVSRYPNVFIHLLGFAKQDNIHEFTKYSRIASFDTTSPLIRAFKDHTKNYYLNDSNGGFQYYKAIRIPQAIENNKLRSLAKEGKYKQEDLIRLEKEALKLIRAYDKGNAEIDATLEAIQNYSTPLLLTPTITDEQLKKKLDALYISYKRTLTDKPWKSCNCAICQMISVEVIIFRSSNRNKRRGIHNLAIFYRHLKEIR